MCLLGVCLGLIVKHLVTALWLNIATLWLVLQEEVVAMEAKQAGVGLRRGINHIKGRIFIIIHSWWVISASGHYPQHLSNNVSNIPFLLLQHNSLGSSSSFSFHVRHCHSIESWLPRGEPGTKSKF